MKIFKTKQNKIEILKEIKFSLEKDLQKLTETNLETIFGLKFIKSEFTIRDFRIDTLAYDDQSNSFVIIEYKRGDSYSIIDQGVTYLSLMLNNKADFVLEYNENTGKNLKRNDVDWSQTKVMFVADAFNQYQTEALGFKDLPIELWQAKQFDNDLFVFNPIRPSTKATASLKSLKHKDKIIEKITKEVRTYDLEYHFKDEWDSSKELYIHLKEKIIQRYPETIERITKFYIAFIDQNVNRSFVEFVGQKRGVKVYLRPFVDQLESPKLKLGDCSEVGHWTNGNSYFLLTSKDDIYSAVELIQQAYRML